MNDKPDDLDKKKQDERIQVLENKLRNLREAFLLVFDMIEHHPPLSAQFYLRDKVKDLLTTYE